MKKVVLKIIITLLVITESSFLFLSYKSYVNYYDIKEKSKQINIYNKTNIFENRDSSLAIQIQNDGDNDYGWHEASDRTKWPDSTKYTYGGAECTDSEGTKITNYHDVLTFDTDTFTATVNTKNSVYCTLYFSKGKSAINVLKESGGDYFAGGGEHTTVVSEMYRYKGTKDQVTNNYICFGTNSIDTCLTTPGTYMFRIIGIQASENATLGIPANSLKIIKAISYGGTVSWGSAKGKTWDNAEINTSTLPAYYNTISTTNNGVNWKNLILNNHYWYIGDISSAGSSEVTTKSTTSNPTGLMYQSDYYNAGNNNKTNWLHILNGWNGNTGYQEWTMSRRWEQGAYYTDGEDGSLSSFISFYNTASSVRPVFYLVSDIKLAGEGTTTNPFIITNKA